MQIKSFKPAVGRIQKRNYTDKEKQEYEEKKTLYKELNELYYLDTFSSKFITKPYLDELKAGILWAPKRQLIVPYLSLLTDRYWVLNYNVRLDVEVPRFCKLLNIRNERSLKLPDQKHDPSQDWF